MLILVSCSEVPPSSFASFDIRVFNTDQILSAHPRIVKLFTYNTDGKISSDQVEREIVDCVLPSRDHVYLHLSFAEFLEKCHIVQ